jgi:hypothetical protein
MNEAALLFSKTVVDQLRIFGAIKSHHSLIRKGLPHYRDEALRENTALVLTLLHDPKDQRIFLNPEEMLRGKYASFAQEITESALSRSQTMTDASCFVFAHSVLDSGIYDYCRVMFLCQPELFAEIVGEKKIKVSDALAHDKSGILALLKPDILEGLRYSSLQKKLDLLHQKLRPDHTHSSIAQYRFDREAIERIDRKRHEIVHRLTFSENQGDVSADIDYVQRTSLYACSLLNWKFGIRVDPNAH